METNKSTKIEIRKVRNKKENAKESAFIRDYERFLGIREEESQSHASDNFCLHVCTYSTR